MGRVDEVRGVALGTRLQAQLAVTGHGRVHEHNGVGQLAIIESLQETAWKSVNLTVA